MAGVDSKGSRPGGQDAVGVEDYVVRTSDGAAAGTVERVSRREGVTALVLERAATPGRHDRTLVDWSDVERVDHEALAVWLRLSADQLDAAPAAAAEDDGPGLSAPERADAPRDRVPSPERDPGGPVDRPLLPLLIAFAGAMAFTALLVVAAATAFETPWLYLGLLLPALILVVTIAVMFRASRRPYEPRGAKKP